MTVEKLTEVSKLLENADFKAKISQISEENDIIPIAKEFGVELSDSDIKELFTLKNDTKEQAKVVAECAAKLDAVLKNSEKAREFAKITDAESFRAFCSRNGIETNEQFIGLLYTLITTEESGTQELSEMEMETVVGGLPDWLKCAVSFIPVVGGVASAIMDVADGTTKGLGNITARLAAGVASGMFDTVATIATGGASLGAKIAIKAGIAAISGGTSIAVKAATK